MNLFRRLVCRLRGHCWLVHLSTWERDSSGSGVRVYTCQRCGEVVTRRVTW